MTKSREGWRINFLRDSCLAINFMKLELWAGKCLESILAGRFTDESVLLEIEERKNIIDLLVGEDACLETLFFLQLQLRDDERLDVFRRLVANCRADVLKQLDYAVFPQILIRSLFQVIHLTHVACSFVRSLARSIVIPHTPNDLVIAIRLLRFRFNSSFQITNRLARLLTPIYLVNQSVIAFPSNRLGRHDHSHITNTVIHF